MTDNFWTGAGLNPRPSKLALSHLIGSKMWANISCSARRLKISFDSLWLIGERIIGRHDVMQGKALGQAGEGWRAEYYYAILCLVHGNMACSMPGRPNILVEMMAKMFSCIRIEYYYNSATLHYCHHRHHQSSITIAASYRSTAVVILPVITKSTLLPIS
jgi:hypothetical protein